MGGAAVAGFETVLHVPGGGEQLAFDGGGDGRAVFEEGADKAEAGAAGQAAFVGGGGFEGPQGGAVGVGREGADPEVAAVGAVEVLPGIGAGSEAAGAFEADGGNEIGGIGAEVLETGGSIDGRAAGDSLRGAAEEGFDGGVVEGDLVAVGQDGAAAGRVVVIAAAGAEQQGGEEGEGEPAGRGCVQGGDSTPVFLLLQAAGVRNRGRGRRVRRARVRGGVCRAGRIR